MSATKEGTARSRRSENRAAALAKLRAKIPVSAATAICSCGRVFYATTTRVAIDARNDHADRKKHSR